MLLRPEPSLHRQPFPLGALADEPGGKKSCAGRRAKLSPAPAPSSTHSAQGLKGGGAGRGKREEEEEEACTALNFLLTLPAAQQCLQKLSQGAWASSFKQAEGTGCPCPTRCEERKDKTAGDRRNYAKVPIPRKGSGREERIFPEAQVLHCGSFPRIPSPPHCLKGSASRSAPNSAAGSLLTAAACSSIEPLQELFYHAKDQIVVQAFLSSI